MEERRRQVGPRQIRPVRRAPQDQQGLRVRGLFGELLIDQLAPGGSPPARQPQPHQVPQFEATAPEPAEGLYIISVAARILSMHPQTLRKYERVGLVRPSRTVGMLRLYSEEDITKLRVIKRLVDELRLNLAGVEMAMAVFERLSLARRQMNNRASAQAFERLFDQIMELFEGSRRTRAEFEE
jgi:MerR family transcriptional regulator/heat shock protein HspR